MVPIRNLSDKQADELAKLHQSVIRSLLSDLGFPFLQRYYRVVREEKSVIGLYALSPKGDIVGWVIGSPSPNQVNDQLRAPIFWFILQMIRVLFRHPRLIWQTILSARTAALDMKPEQVELTYIGVAPSARRLGVGNALMNAFVQVCSGRYRSVVLSVEVENDNAIRLYTKRGFKVVNTFIEGAFQRHRMELSI